MRDCDDDTYEMTLAEVGQHLGVTYQRVQQIESRALKKARCAFAIVEQLGHRAAPLLEQLAGKDLRYFRAAVLGCGGGAARPSPRR